MDILIHCYHLAIELIIQFISNKIYELPMLNLFKELRLLCRIFLLIRVKSKEFQFNYSTKLDIM